ADLIFMDKRRKNVVILEIKVSKSDDDFEQDTNDALLQIEKKKYYEPLLKKVNIETIYCYGISFYNKQCYLLSRKVK
ncbi:PD-(D/E)XK nuclease domain-containing protein, partial [Succinivibrio sp.]